MSTIAWSKVCPFFTGPIIKKSSPIVLLAKNTGFLHVHNNQIKNPFDKTTSEIPLCFVSN